MIGQEDNGDLGRIVASEERGPYVQAFAQERGRGRDDGHFGQAGELRLHVRFVQFGAVGEIGACVGGIVVYQDDADGAGGLEEGEEGIVLVRLAAVDEG